MSGLATLGNKAMAKFGSSKATGKLDVGATANQLHKEFQVYLGKTGREATKDAVIGFLSGKGYPTKGAATLINQELKGQGPAPSGAMANMKATASQLGSNAKQAMAKGVSNVINKVTDKLRPADATEPEKVEPTGDVAPAKTGSFNNQTGGGKANYSMSTGFDKNTMKNTSTPMAADEVPNPKKKKVAVSASKVNTGNPLSEAPIPGVLSQGIIDKAFLKAAQENEIVKSKQGRAPAATTGNATSTQSAPSAGASTGSQGGFTAGLKKGFTGKAPATPDINQLAQRIAAIEKKVGLA